MAGLELEIGATVAKLAQDMAAIEARVAKAAAKAEGDWKRASAAGFDGMGKSAAKAVSDTQRSINDLVGVTSRGAKSAKEAASAFGDAFDQADKVDRLRASLDPVFAATQRHKDAVLQLKMAVAAGTIEQAEANKILALSEARLKAATAAANGLGTATAAPVRGMGRLGGTMGQVGFQIGDFATQVGAGTSAMQAAGQQAPQLLGAFGPVGAVLGAVAAVAIPLGAAFINMGDGAEEGAEGLDELKTALAEFKDYSTTAHRSIASLREEFGDFADEVKETAGYLAEAALGRALTALAAVTEPFRDGIEDAIDAMAAFEEARDTFNRAQSQGIATATQLADFEDAMLLARDRMVETAGALGLVPAEVDRIASALSAVESASGMEEVRDQAQAALDLIARLYPEGTKLPPVLAEAVVELGNIRDAAAAGQAAAEGLTGEARATAEAFREAAAEARGISMETAGRGRNGRRIANMDADREGRPEFGGTPLDLARSMMGRAENVDRTAIMAYFERGGVDLDPVAQAWCAAFVNATLEQAGISGTGSNLARSFLNWGREVQGAPQVGDIGVLPRGNNPELGHVGIVSAVNDNGSVTIVGGNQGSRGEVSEQTYNASEFLGFRRADPFGEEAAEEARRDADEAEREAESAAKKAADALMQQARAGREVVTSSQDMAEAMAFEATIAGKSAGEQARLRAEYEMLHELRRLGIDLDAEATESGATYREEVARLSAEIGRQTTAEETRVATAEAAVERQKMLADLAAETSGILGDAFVDAVQGVEGWADAARQAIAGMIADLARLIVQQTIYNALARAMGQEAGPDLVGTLLGGVTGLSTGKAEGGPVGFAEGRYTGHGAKHQVAGTVHKGEYVFDAAATRRIGVGTLELLRKGGLAMVRPGFAEGGLAGLGSYGGGAARPVAPQVSVSTPVEVVNVFGEDDLGRMLNRPGVRRVLNRIVTREGN